MEQDNGVRNKSMAGSPFGERLLAMVVRVIGARGSDFRILDPTTMRIWSRDRTRGFQGADSRTPTIVSMVTSERFA